MACLHFTDSDVEQRANVVVVFKGQTCEGLTIRFRGSYLSFPSRVSTSPLGYFPLI